MTRLCPTPGCPNVTKRGKCPACRRQAARDRGPRPYDKQKYKRARRRVVSQLCECRGCDACTHVYPTDRCDRVAEQADHVVRLVDGGDPYATSNLRGMCQPCHVERHRGEGHFLTQQSADHPRMVAGARRPKVEIEGPVRAVERKGVPGGGP
jgi:5-methylcytosine-specific restriction enzyme A